MPKNSGAGQYPIRNSWEDKIYQPPFDPRTTKLTFQGGGKDGQLESGRIIAAPDKRINMGYMGFIGVRFLYNPSEIALSYSADPNAPIPENVNNPLNLGQTMAASGSLSFALLFDRTYDTWGQEERMKDKTNLGKQMAAKYGCYVDVRQFYLMLGMLAPPDQSGTNGNSVLHGGSSTGLNNLWEVPGYELQRGAMVSTPVQVYFGGKDSLTYYGRIEGFNVTYTHFTNRMTPNRCVINVSMTTWIKPKKGFKGAKGDAGGGEDGSTETTG